MRLLVYFWAVLCFTGSSAAEPFTVASNDLQFPEGVIFVNETVYFVDYGTSTVFRIEGHQTIPVWHRPGCDPTGLARVTSGLMVACYDGNTFDVISLDGRVLETLTHDVRGAPFVVPNDLALDGKGGIYLTASGASDLPGKVYYRRGDGDVIPVATGLKNANGLVVTVDGRTLLVAESSTDKIWRYAIEPDGKLGQRFLFIDLQVALKDDALHRHFGPDGLRMDQRGNLYIALYDGGGFAIFDGDGKLVKKIDLPRAHHTSLAISPDQRTVYATAVDDTPSGGYQGELLEFPNPIAP